MTVSRRFGSLILTVSLLALLTAGSVLVSQATSERNTTTTTKPAADPGASSIEGMATSPSATNEPPSKKEAPASATSPANDGKPKDPKELPATSEELIAAALEASTINYETSLRERAFALYNDPRLDARFRSPVIDWEAGRALFAEIDEKAATLSKELLADLAPIRARPSDVISVFNRPRADKQSSQGPRRESLVRRVATRTPAQARCISVTKMDVSWKSYLVPGTNIRLWIQYGTEGELKNVFAPMVGKVWRAFPDYFTYPLPDNGNVCDESNPDSAVDMYLVIGSTLDPREKLCGLTTAPSGCTLSSLRASGATQSTESATPPKSSAYMMINIDTPDRTLLLDTIAHELAHAGQCAYDAHDDNWLMESTATWVAFKVFKALGNTPREEYRLLRTFYGSDLVPVFPNLDKTLIVPQNRYGGWLFFYSASVDLGDNIVKAVWQAAVGPPRGIEVVDRVIPLDKHFPRYAVRSWNQDLTPQPWPYKTDDKTFPPDLKPDPITPVKFLTASIQTLNQPVDPLAARYHRVTFAAGIRKVTFENFFSDIPYAHVWAVKKIGNDWKEPEDWSKEEQKIFCRDLADENLTELVIVVSNTHRQFPLPADPAPRIIGDSVGCEYIAGWAQASLRVKQGDNDVSYVSNRANLKFKPRASPLQTTSGATQYDLMPTAVTWTATGKEGDCEISGQITIGIPSFENQPLDALVTQPAFGYMNVVGLDGGDFHSVKVSATNRNAFFKKTCPGDPPTVTKYYSGVAWVLLVLSEKNTYVGPTVEFKGTKTVDLAGPTGFLSMLPPGTVLPDIALQALRQQQPASNKSEVYTWNWELHPLNFGTTSGP